MPDEEGKPLMAAGDEDAHLVNPIMVKFLYGQYANLFKFALWWTTLAPLTFALFEKDATAIGVGRITYNVALCIMSPIGGIVCERVHPRKVLLGAATTRFIIWCLLVPGTWVLFESGVVVKSQTVIWVLFNLFLVFDGASVALSTVLDIDLCGVDIVAGRFGFEITDAHRNQFNGRQELFFAACFTLFTPAMAFLGLAINKAFEGVNDSMSESAMESGTLVGIFFLAFAIATVLQFYYFRQLPADKEAAEVPAAGMPVAPSEQSLHHLDGSTQHNDGTIADPVSVQDAPPSGWDAVRSVPSDLLEALKIIWQHPPILFRLVFLGLEIAFEDAAIVVIASQMGITLPWLGNNDGVNGNIWTSCGIAAGKFGGALASIIMIRCYTPPEQPRKFITIFALILLSCMVVLVFPATVYAYDQGVIGAYPARVLYLGGFFVYFFLSTLPKLGLMCLFQSMISQVENGPRVFGFIAIVATTFDSLVIMALSMLFVKVDNIQDALWYTAFVYLAHGVLEMIVGPIFVLRPLQSSADAQVHDIAQESETSKLTTSAGTEMPTEPQAGTYSHRSASILVAVPNQQENVDPRTPRGVSHRAAVFSVSHTAASGSVAVTRRISNFEVADRVPRSGVSNTIEVRAPRERGGDDDAVSGGTAVSFRAGTSMGGGFMGTSYHRQGSRLAPLSPRNR